MAWPHYNPHITVVDVLDTGACLDGILRWLEAHDGLIRTDLREHLSPPTNPFFILASCGVDSLMVGLYPPYGYHYTSFNGDGIGSGNGYGDNDRGEFGDGLGCGDNYGFGNADGDGVCEDDEDGDGFGMGFRYGVPDESGGGIGPGSDTPFELELAWDGPTTDES